MHIQRDYIFSETPDNFLFQIVFDTFLAGIHLFRKNAAPVVCFLATVARDMKNTDKEREIDYIQNPG